MLYLDLYNKGTYNCSSMWSNWTACNVSCGTGYQSRNRTWYNVVNDERSCNGTDTQVKQCNMTSCPTPTPTFSTPTPSATNHSATTPATTPATPATTPATTATTPATTPSATPAAATPTTVPTTGELENCTDSIRKIIVILFYCSEINFNQVDYYRLTEYFKTDSLQSINIIPIPYILFEKLNLKITEVCARFSKQSSFWCFFCTFKGL